MTSRILITAFEPFGGEAVNTSAEVLRLLPNELSGWTVQKALLPVVFGRAAEEALKTPADLIVLLGEAGGRRTVTPELRARNFRDARIPDNAGHQPRQEKILETGPETYETPVPVEALCRQMQQEGYAIEPSQDAGAYVCNDTFYLTGLQSPAPVSFIHVPAQPDQAEAYARTVARVIELAVGAIQE